MANQHLNPQLKRKVAESIRVRGIASSLLNMTMPSFEALNNLLEMEGYQLIRSKTNNNESDKVKSIEESY